MGISHDLTLPEHMERRYTRGGSKAHVVSNLGGVLPYETALCGRQPALFTSWYGSGTQDEIETAAALPLCRICAERLARINFLKAVWGPGMVVSPRPGEHKPQEGRCIIDGHPWPCKTRIKEMTTGAATQAR